MANIELTDGKTINVLLDGTTDWDSRASFPKGLLFYAISFKPSAANDKLVVRDNGPDGMIIFYGADIIAGGLTDRFKDVVYKPYIKAADCTVAEAGKAVAIIKLKMIL